MSKATNPTDKRKYYVGRFFNSLRPTIYGPFDFEKAKDLLKSYSKKNRSDYYLLKVVGQTQTEVVVTTKVDLNYDNYN